jgi:hypothetical protein
MSEKKPAELGDSANIVLVPACAVGASSLMEMVFAQMYMKSEATSRKYGDAGMT